MDEKVIVKKWGRPRGSTQSQETRDKISRSVKARYLRMRENALGEDKAQEEFKN